MKKLALSGGSPVVPADAIQRWPVILDQDIRRVETALRSGKLWGRKTPHAMQLQEALCSYFNRDFCLLTPSGTSALHTALAALGIGPGDEVITTAYSFIATGLAILHANAIPVFTDIDPISCNISIPDIENKISPATKAILPVHMHGLPADMDEINLLAKKYGLAVIEDGSQAHGAEYKNDKIGSLSDVACFSLNGSKNLSTGGDGGFLLTNSREVYEKARSIATYGKGATNPSNWEDQISGLGYMYRMQELPASLALGQLERLDQNNTRRIHNAGLLSKGLQAFPGLEIQEVPPDRTHVYYTYRMRFNPKKQGLEVAPRTFREAVEKALFAEGVPIGQSDRLPLNKYPLFRKTVGYGKGCPWSCNFYPKDPPNYDDDTFIEVEKLFEDYSVIRGIHPPNGSDLMNLYLEAFHKVFQNLEEVLELSRSYPLPSNTSELFGGYS